MYPLVDVHWLKTNLENPNLIILDSSPSSTVSGQHAEFDQLVIPNSLYFDLKNVFSDKSAAFPNTLLKPEDFQKASQDFGINSDSILIIYDNLGIYTSPRVWWMFKVMGHKQVAVLNGGLPEWIKQHYEVSLEHSKPKSTGNFVASFNPNQVKSIDEVLKNCSTKESILVDARSAGRFNGTSPEPRKDILSGHIPDSINIPFESVLTDGLFKTESELLQLFSEAISSSKPLIFSCGSGLTACIILLAYELIAEQSTSIFDGSWTEWASTSGMPIEQTKEMIS